MARIDDLVARAADPSLRREMEVAFKELKRRQRFGLVCEEHIPETTDLYGFPIQTGSLVQKGNDPQAPKPCGWFGSALIRPRVPLRKQ